MIQIKSNTSQQMRIIRVSATVSLLPLFTQITASQSSSAQKRKRRYYFTTPLAYSKAEISRKRNIMECSIMHTLWDGCASCWKLLKKIENTVIIMDNSKYHKQIPYYTPQMSYKKAKLPDKCSKKGIQVSYKSIKTEIWKLIDPFIRNTLPIIFEMSKAEVHDVIFYPPH